MKYYLQNIQFVFTAMISTFFLGCGKAEKPLIYKANNKSFQYYGRYEFVKTEVALISPGAYAVVNFSGDVCEIYLKGERSPYNYVTFELDGKYLGRTKIESNAVDPYVLKVSPKQKIHTLKIVKDSEASNGGVLFGGIKVRKVLKKDLNIKPLIEFIGNSITCGALADGSITPCNKGVYFDNHNTYKSYGPTLARALNANFMLSSVSGIGIYRNWNDENIKEPTLPQVYENLYLDTNSFKKYSFNKIPDVVSICLGTNDLSEGDGVKPRLPFNKKKYVDNYIKFIKTVYKHYPKTQIVLLNSPMVVGEKNTLLILCLKEIQTYFSKNTDKSILLFEFNKAYIHGCSEHPSMEEHKQIAQKLMLFFKNILNRKS